MDHTAAVLTHIESGNAGQVHELSSKFIEAIEVRKEISFNFAPPLHHRSPVH